MGQKSVTLLPNDLIIFRGKKGLRLFNMLIFIKDPSREYNQTQLAKKLRVSRTSVKRYSRELQERGLIYYKRIGNNVFYTLTEKGAEALKRMNTFDVPYDTLPKRTILSVVRSHAIRIKVPILRLPYNPEAFKEDVMRVGKLTKMNTKMNGWTQYIGYLPTGKEYGDGGHFYFTPKNLIITFKQIYSFDPFDSIDKAIKYTQKLIKEIEEYPPYYGLKLGDVSYVGKIIHRHHALPGDEAAKMFIKYGIDIRTDRIHIDCSKGPGLESQNLIHNEFGQMTTGTMTILQYISNLSRALIEKDKKLIELENELEKVKMSSQRDKINKDRVKSVIKKIRKATFKNIYSSLKKEMGSLELQEILEELRKNGEIIFKNGRYRLKDS